MRAEGVVPLVAQESLAVIGEIEGKGDDLGELLDAAQIRAGLKYGAQSAYVCTGHGPGSSRSGSGVPGRRGRDGCPG